MNEKLKEMREAWKNLYGSLFKWIVLSGVIGSLIGLIASGFSYAIVWATSFRQANPMIILGLPLGGLLIVWLYKITGQEKNSGTNLVLTVVRSDEEEVPGWVTPLILISTAITHLFGGSSGREGAALQFGASVGNVCAKYLHLNESDKKIIILASMSAAFSALFGTPMAAVVFPMEVISVGVMYYAALVPCVFSAFAAQGIALLLKVRTVTPPYLVESVPNFYSVDSIKAIILAIACALAGALFCIVLHNGEHYLKKWFPNPYVRVVAGALCLAAAKALALLHGQPVTPLILRMARMALDPVVVNGVRLAQVQQAGPEVAVQGRGLVRLFPAAGVDKCR